MSALGTVHVLFIAPVTASMLAGQTPLVSTTTTLYSHGGYLQRITERAQNWAEYRAAAIFILPLSMVLSCSARTCIARVCPPRTARHWEPNHGSRFQHQRTAEPVNDLGRSALVRGGGTTCWLQSWL